MCYPGVQITEKRSRKRFYFSNDTQVFFTQIRIPYVASGRPATIALAILALALKFLVHDRRPISLNCIPAVLYKLLGADSRTRTNTNPNDTEANAAGRSVRACVARK